MPSPPEKKKLTCIGFFETDMLSSIFGRTDPRIGASKAKNREEVDFELPKPPNPPKLAKKRKKRDPRPNIFAQQFFFRRTLN